MLRVFAVVTVVALALVGVLALAGIWADDPVEQRADSVQPVGQEREAEFEQRASPQEQSLGAQSVEIRDGGVSPQQLQMAGAQPIQVEVINRSGEDCTFFIGGYLQDLEVPAGERTAQSLTLPLMESSDVVTMGCVGDEERQGSAVVEFRGVLPGQSGQEPPPADDRNPAGNGQ
jgi:hypothetical protein